MRFQQKKRNSGATALQVSIVKNNKNYFFWFDITRTINIFNLMYVNLKNKMRNCKCGIRKLLNKLKLSQFLIIVDSVILMKILLLFIKLNCSTLKIFTLLLSFLILIHQNSHKIIVYLFKLKGTNKIYFIFIILILPRILKKPKNSFFSQNFFFLRKIQYNELKHDK